MIIIAILLHHFIALNVDQIKLITVNIITRV
nr:MAG TPA: hypothetical protein [Caudoviricetes sp.]